MSSPYAEVCEDNSPTDSVIGRDFQELSAEEQERQRDEWKAELRKTEEEVLTLKQVLGAEDLLEGEDLLLCLPELRLPLLPLPLLLVGAQLLEVPPYH